MKPKYLWLDVETTGLGLGRVCQDRILEVALVITDANLDEIVSFETVIGFDIDATGVDVADFVRDMHTKNGLWLACKSASIALDGTDYLDDVLCEYVHGWEGDEKPILAGSTVHFDRKFLNRWCPEFEGMLHHRHYDVSAIKLMRCDMLGEPFVKAEAHRAMADVRESLAHARQIRYEIEGGSWSDQVYDSGADWGMDV